MRHGTGSFLLFPMVLCGMVGGPALSGPSATPAGRTDSAGPVPVETVLVRTWRTAEGLPGNHVECLCQTADGYLWIGTASGLVRFNGTDFREIETPSGATERTRVVKDLAESKSGDLWVATKGGVWVVGDEGTRLWDSKDGLPSDEATSLAPARNGGMWIGTTAGLAFWEGEGLRGRIVTLPRQGARDPAVASVVEDPEGRVWLGTRDGLIAWDPIARRETIAWVSDGAPPYDHDEHDHVWSVGVDGEGTVWAGADGRVLRIREGRVAVLPVVGSGLRSRVSKVLPESGERIRFVVDDHLFRRKGDRLVADAEAEGFGRSSVRDAFWDRQGNGWIGTRYGGVSRVRRVPWRVFSQADGLCHDSVRAVGEGPDGAMWFATDRGVSRWDGVRFSSPVSTPDISKETFRSVLVTANGDLWVGRGEREGGYLRAVKDGFEGMILPAVASREPRLVFAESPGRIWLAGGTDLSLHLASPWRYFDPTRQRWVDHPYGVTWRYGPGFALRFEDSRRWRFERQHWIQPAEDGGATNRLADLPPEFASFLMEPGLSDYRVSAMAREPGGGLWMGTFSGLNLLESGRVTTFRAEDGLGSDRITALSVRKDGGLWVGTDQGIARRKDGGFRHVSVASGLFESQVHQIVDDGQGRLWISGPQGIYWVSETALEAVLDGKAPWLSYTLLESADGLAGHETHGGSQPAGCRSREGRLWFATTQGALAIDPQAAEVSASMIGVRIESVGVGGRRVFGSHRRGSDGAGNAVELSAGSGRSLEIRYEALEFAHPERVRFEHRLEGHDAGWVEAGNRTAAYYTNLRPGLYGFRVKARGPDGVWWEMPSPFRIRLLPFGHERTSVRIVVGLVLVGLAVAAYRWRIGELRRWHALREATALARERARISHDLHDDLGNSLTQIAFETTMARHRLETEGSVAESLDRVEGLAQQAVDDLSELIWATDDHHDGLAELSAYLRAHAARCCEQRAVACRLDFPREMPVVAVSAEFRRNVFLVLKEALGNALKHAGPSSIEIRFHVLDGAIELTVRDDGCGFVPSPDIPGETTDGMSRRGLANLRRRAAALGGRLEIRSRPGEGTTVRLWARMPTTRD